MYRPTWAEINLENIIGNYQSYSSMHPNKVVIPVVKANAYGHGAKHVVTALKKIGVTLFAVSLIEEGIELRLENHDIDILVMGPISESCFKAAIENDLIVTLSNYNVALDAMKSGLPIRCHVKYDTGMNRLGFKSINELIDVFNRSRSSLVSIEGIYTHFATADQNDAILAQQNTRFVKLLKKLHYIPRIVHVSNSSGILNQEDKNKFTTHARLGIGLYGLSLDNEKKHLKPAMTIKTKVMHLKELTKGEKVGYGANYTALENERIAILPIGYADGFIRANKNGYVSIKNKKYQIIGSICMDMIFVKVDDTVSVNDTVIIMGDKIVTIDDVAKRLNTINYEIVCLISSRIPRHYIERINNEN